MTANKFLSILTLLAAVVSPALAGTTKGAVIRGKVVNEYGAPVPLSQVLVEDQDAPKPKEGVVVVDARAVPWVESDGQGDFLIDGLIARHRYKVYTKNEEQGYPDVSDLFYNPEDKGPVVVASNTPEEVQIKIGPKGVLLKYSAVDELTGKQIQNLIISVRRGDGKEGGFDASALGNQILLPADAPIIVSVSAKGYRTWYYPSGVETEDAARPIRAYAGSTEQINARLSK